MAKRATSNLDGAAAFRKRQKITHEAAPAGEDVTSSEQLRGLLSFGQDLRLARHGLQSLKKLLDDLVSDRQHASDKLDIIRQYLEAVKPRDVGDDAVHLSDIMDMWSFAVQAHDEGVMSSAAVVLALLLQVISDELHLVPYGLGICQTLLQERQLKSISKNLSAEKSKAFVISPTLRLLREAVSLDGGAFAKRIFRAREYTFTSLGRNLEIIFVGDGPEDPRKTSVRTNAIRFFTACLRYLHSDGRRELLSQKDLVSHLTFLMRSDPPPVLIDVLDSLKKYALADDKIPRDVKLRCFNTKTLVRFVGLYTYTFRGDPQEPVVVEKAHELLLYTCTTQNAGVLYPSTGLYPKLSNEDMPTSRNTRDSSALDSLWQGSFKDGIPVYNFVLSELGQKLKPWSGTKHSELLIGAFKAAPELIADYFYNNRSFTFEPKLTMTWIGYAAFLFNTMMIPIPPSFGDRAQYAKRPPPTSIILDNILPFPINQKVLVRCLSTASHLTSFFATRILVAALEKLSTATKMLAEGFRSTDSIWCEASRRLVDAFCQRIPDMKEIVRSYKSIPANHVLHRTVASRLLRLYYEVIPRVALAANFDVSPLLVENFTTLQADSECEPRAAELGILELENLVSIASFSPGMRWFSKMDRPLDGLTLSPFTAMLRVLCTQERFHSSVQLRRVLESVAIESQLVSTETKLSALLKALHCVLAKGSDSFALWSFVDNCVSRGASSPIKYVDILETNMNRGTVKRGDGTLTLLLFVMQEQLPFALKTANSNDNMLIVKFLSLYLNATNLLNESSSVTHYIHEGIQEELSSYPVAMSKIGDKGEIKALKKVHIVSVQETEGTSEEENLPTFIDDTALQQSLDLPPMNGDDTGVLVKWTSQGVEDLVEEDWAVRLIRLLLSEHIHIRKEALTNLLKMAALIKESSYEEKDQIWLLLSELAESSRSQVDIGPVPSPLAAFAVHALEVLRNPLHVLYPKINNFLTRGPFWSPDKLPLAHDILHGEPSEDDRYYTELTWLLTYLLDGLRTPADLAVFHKKRWFEKIFALAGNPYLRSNLWTRILRILYRATSINGGATMLATRFGIFSWLEMQKAACDLDEDAALYEALMRRTWDTCDQDKIKIWSKGTLPERITAPKADVVSI